MADPTVAPVVVPDPPPVEENKEPLRGEELVFQFAQMAESIQKDLIKFFDKGQKAAARRVRKDLAALSKFNKAVRLEISQVKAERYPKE